MPHRKWLFGWLVFSAAAIVAGTSRANAAEPQFDEAALEHFEKQVRPILVQRCYECHSGKAEEPKGGLRLDSREGLLAGGDTGPAVDLAAPSKSLLLDAVNYGELYQMPPKSKLPEAEIAVLRTWVERGAPWPSEKNAAVGSLPKAEFDLQARKQSHWAWQPVRRLAPPAVRDAAWPLQTLDAFILAGLEAKGIPPAPPADRRTLLRRLSFDLIGLPPTPAQVEAFVQGRDQHALETVVDQLLDSPHFGERWGRHWLDLVRYAESRGHEFDPDVPGAWQYRDYVIRALNADVPYDQFVREHFAGDLLPQPRLNPDRGFNESILGTGFWYLGEWVHSPVDIRQDEADRMDNMLDVASKAFLGVTLACARCHDHKFDAISQRDYYALAGFLQSTTYRQVCFETMEQNARVAADWERLQQEARPKMASAAAESRKAVVGKLSEYLLAARDLESKSAGSAGAVPSANEMAETRGLNADVLARWVTHLREVRTQPRDPFHAWALSGDGAGFEATRRRVLEQSEKQRAAEPSTASVRTIVDYRAASSEAWMVDGPIFGAAPVGAGTLIAGADAPSSIRIAEYSAARRDPFWNGLKLAPDAGGEPGRSGAWVRADRTLRTPTFTIEADNVYCLVRGSAHIYAVVDSHRVNNGPLHGSLVGGFQNIPQPQWIAHPLARYRGQRAHLEFSARDSEPLEILQVVQADRPPAIPFDRPNGLLVKALAEANTPEELATGYRETFQRVVLALSANAIAGSDSAAEIAPLANWLLEHPELTVEDPAQTAPATALDEEFARRQDLAGKIASESHTAPAMWEGDSVDEFLLIRGNPRTAGEAVPRRLLEAIAGNEAIADERGSGRLALARQIASPENPLTARVAVNRVWHHLMGRGIVASVDNFGVLGEPPTHPELLDQLAAQFVDEGWSLKRLIRTIVLSRTYQMSSAETPEADAADPANLLLHRMRIRRLEGEAIRDAILAVSGRLDRTLYGPSIPVHLTAFMQGRGRPGQSGPLDGAGRRSIYGAVRRNFLSPMMTAFDAPAPFNTMGRRNVSNVPAQALILMNDPFVVEQAKVWAERELSPNDRSIDEHIERLYLTAFSRPPSPKESAAARAFLEADAADLGLAPEQAATDPRPWSELCHALFNVKEFIFVR